MTETAKTSESAQTAPTGKAPRSAKSVAKKTPAREAVATPWGRAAVVQRLSVPQRAGEKRFASVLELLELAGGEQLVRIAYTTDGHARRGPVTLRLRDLARLREAVRRAPALAEVIAGEGA